MGLAKLTYVHWHNRRRGALLLNPAHVIAVTPMDGLEDEGDEKWRGHSQVQVAGYSYCVAETVEEVGELLKAAETPKE